MNNLPSHLYHQIQQLSDEVCNDFKRKGIVPPIKNDDGSVTLGYYKIVKNDNGYTIFDSNQQPVVENLNLPQSAVLLANNMALGKFKDKTVIENDKKYGYALFDEELHIKAANKKKNKKIDHIDLMLTKAAIAKSKKEYYKRELVNRYEKLIQLV